MFADMIRNFQPPFIPLLGKEGLGEIPKDLLLSNMLNDCRK
jgi:hypothetical protein